MPNSQNRSKDQSNIVKPKRRTTKASVPSPNKEQPNKKQGDLSKDIQGSAGNASNARSEEVSDSSLND